MLSSLELFSGAGGLAKGIENAGARHKAFVEWNADACKTLRYNYCADIVHQTDVYCTPKTGQKKGKKIIGKKPLSL